jgi:hexosaminidase
VKIPAIIPQPVHLEIHEGSFELKPNTRVISGAGGLPAAELFCTWVSSASGRNLLTNELTETEQPNIEFRIDPGIGKLGTESYQLEISHTKILATSSHLDGLRHAAQTIRQLLPDEIFSTKANGNDHWYIPCLNIEDYPRYAWRGAMLDVARHFFPPKTIYRFLDLLAIHKLNTFHWHLTDDQGWRIEIKRYPKLAEVGSYRKQTLKGHYRDNRENPQFDGITHSGFYTQDDIRKIVNYAEKLGIRIVPEIEMPGHAQAAIAAYPELGNLSEPIEVSTSWGVHEHIFNVEPSTIHFLQNVLNEVIDLFPGQFIHIGGDEVPKKEWRGNPSVQEQMKKLGIDHEDGLQSYFIRQMEQYLTAHGRRLLGWDEILEGGLAPNATVMSWRGEAGGISAARAGHDVVMAPNTYTYFDYYQSPDIATEPISIGGFIPLEKVYEYEPIPGELEKEFARHILGTQGQLWTEYISTPHHLEYMAFPRLTALSEVAWSPISARNFEDFQSRLRQHLCRLEHLGVNYRKLE